jgi:hypothetical protein
MIISKIENIYILIKAQTIVVKVGYPDYLDSENMTKLENIYAEVCYRNALFLIDYSSVIFVSLLT